MRIKCIWVYTYLDFQYWRWGQKRAMRKSEQYARIVFADIFDRRSACVLFEKMVFQIFQSGIFLSTPSIKKLMKVWVFDRSTFLMNLRYYIMWLLHCNARAASSTAKSGVTGSLPWSTSCLTCRKNWYLVISSTNRQGSAA